MNTKVRYWKNTGRSSGNRGQAPVFVRLALYVLCMLGLGMTACKEPQPTEPPEAEPHFTEFRFIKTGYPQYQHMDFNINVYFPEENVTNYMTTSKCGAVNIRDTVRMISQIGVYPGCKYQILIFLDHIGADKIEGVGKITDTITVTKQDTLIEFRYPQDTVMCRDFRPLWEERIHAGEKSGDAPQP